jgi:hypothetical protein
MFVQDLNMEAGGGLTLLPVFLRRGRVAWRWEREECGGYSFESVNFQNTLPANSQHHVHGFRQAGEGLASQLLDGVYIQVAVMLYMRK